MNKIEILSPAGSKDSFTAAIEAGADAIYCGLKDFSARSKAENFSVSDFFSFVEYAHKKNVKVYAALNTLIKQSEITKAVKLINIIACANADGIIVQDLGIAEIVKNYFPSLKLHASTQLSLHNSAGIIAAQKAGFKRVVLARELSVSEIKEIRQKTNAELEIFCHGALCFSISGLCLMSSFIGGYSGNRGCCAQPCRRLWNFGNKKGFYLSPKDLDLSQHIGEILNSGITSLKIEGRMKNAQYVYKTVKAYRMLVDSNGSEEGLKQAREILKYDFGRQKTSFNFIKKSEDIFSPEASKQIGISAGKVYDVQKDSFKIKTSLKLNAGDILKGVDAKNDFYAKINILSIDFNDGVYCVKSDSPFIKNGMEIFKISDEILQKELDKIAQKASKETMQIKREIKETNIPFPKIPKEHAKEELFIKINNPSWIKLIKNKNIIFTLSDSTALSQELLNRVEYFEIPAFIPENKLPFYKDIISKLKIKNKAFFLNNIAHFAFFTDGKTKLYAGNGLYCLNIFSASFLLKQGIKAFAFSVEDDFSNISSLAKTGLASKGIFYLSGLIPLAFSAMRQHKDLGKNETISSNKDSFVTIQKDGITTVIPKYPIMLFNKKRLLKNIGVNKFEADLSFIPPDKNYLSCIIDAFNEKRTLANGQEFNFERGLK